MHMQNEQINKIKENGLLKPTLDVVFQVLFGEVGSEEFTKDFLEKILKRKITQLDLSKNPVLRRERINDKMGILDMIAKINNDENVHIEMQCAKQDEIRERILYYWSRIYSRDIKKGNEYGKLEKTISILIVDFEAKELQDLEYHTVWKIIEDKYRKTILTDKLEIRIINLTKIHALEKEEDELLDWLFFLTNPKCERVEEKMKKSKPLKNAYNKLNEMSNDEQMEQIAWWRYKAILEENTARTNGYKKGQEDTKEQIAKEMLKLNIDIETISKVTGLPKETISKLESK